MEDLLDRLPARDIVKDDCYHLVLESDIFHKIGLLRLEHVELVLDVKLVVELQALEGLGDSVYLHWVG